MKLLSTLVILLIISALSSYAQPYYTLPSPGPALPNPPLAPPTTTFGLSPNTPFPQLWIWSKNNLPVPASIGLERFTTSAFKARSQWGIATLPSQFSSIATTDDVVIVADEGEDLILAARHNGLSEDPAKGDIRFSTVDHMNMSYPNDMERMTIQSGGDVTIGGSLGIGFTPDQSLLSDPVNWQQQRKLDVRGGQVGITPPADEAGILTIMPSKQGSWWNIANILDGGMLAFMDGDMLSNIPTEVDGNGNLDPASVKTFWANAPLVIAKFGTVGMGTLEPDIYHALHVHNKPILFSSNTSNAKLETAIASTAGYFSSSSTAGDVIIRTVDGASTEDLIVASSNQGASLKFATRSTVESDNSVKMTIFDNGNVGIGIDQAPYAKLAVNGTICAEELKVLLTTTSDAACWPDYVFDEGYDLMPLDELEKWVKTRRHLPNVPSQIDVEKNGVGVGEMQAQLLRKVEELTLYVIQLKQENNEIRAELDSLKEKDTLNK